MNNCARKKKACQTFSYRLEILFFYEKLVDFPSLNNVFPSSFFFATVVSILPTLFKSHYYLPCVSGFRNNWLSSALIISSQRTAHKYNIKRSIPSQNGASSTSWITGLFGGQNQMHIRELLQEQLCHSSCLAHTVKTINNLFWKEINEKEHVIITDLR